MADAAQYVSRMVAALAVTEPELDTSIGSPVRKILDAVSEVAAEVGVDSHLLNYQFDIDSKVGADLDDFALMFGQTRLQAQRATGTITFSRPTASPVDIQIPAFTQVVTATSPQVAFVTAAPAFLTAGAVSVEVPIVAVNGGEAGNLQAGAITVLASPVDGISSRVTNTEATSGGTNTEPDDAFIARFKRTVFRSMAGTEDMYLGVTLEASGADGETPTQAVVIGASKRWREQIQIGADGTALSTIPVSNVKYIFPNSSVLGADIDSGSILTPEVHYTFDPDARPPKITGLSGALTVGGLYDLEFEYVPSASRNDPVTGITNRVDVWCNGVKAVQATEALFFRSTNTFTSGANDTYGASKFVRKDTPGQHPTVGNIFLRLAWGPILTFPSTLTIAGVTYHYGTDYQVVHDDSAFGYGPTSLFGLEWLASNVPPENAAISLSGASAYTYNRVPREVEDRIRRWRLVGTDARAHAAKRVNLRLSLAVMFDQSYDRTQVTDGIRRALAAYLDTSGFDARIQVSDLLQVAHGVRGVDNVRFLTSTEPTNTDQYAIERVSDDGDRISYVTVGSSPARAADLYLGDNEIPVLYAVNVVAKAANTYGVL